MLLHVIPLVLAFSGQTPPPTTPPATPRQAVIVTAPGQTAPQTPRPAPPPPFDEKADAAAAIDKAVAAAATDGIRVLLVWGANNDPGWAAYTKARTAPEISKATPSFFSDEYKLVYVNVGHLDANTALATKYGAHPKAGELPALTILDDKGNVLANTSVAAFRTDDEAAGVDPAKLAVFLKSHQAPFPNAAAQFEAAVKQAKKADKTVFVWFSAPW